MARRPSAEAVELMQAQAAEREENADLNEAIARTDSEVFTDAMGDEPLEDDAGTELEDMGDGLEGEELEDQEQEEQAPEGKQQASPEGEEEPAEEVEEEEGEETGDADEGEREAPASFETRPPQPSIPPRVLRETRERARAENDELRSQIRDLQMRLDNFGRQPQPQVQPQPQPQPQPTATPRPDQFADPDGHDNWLIAEADRRAEARFNARFEQMQQQQQREFETRLNENLAQTAQGPRAYEFNVAYRDLTSLEKTPENAALVRRLTAQPDVGAAILDWWEQSSNSEYIEYHRDQIRQAYGTPRNPRGTPQRQNGRVNGRQPQPGQVRHEVRLPRSLSDATGGRSQHVNDPDMFDGAEESIFAYGARR